MGVLILIYKLAMSMVKSRALEGTTMGQIMSMSNVNVARVSRGEGA